MMDIVFDMETNDPDDFLTLLLLLGHPAVRLKAVTITPGSPYQVGLVREALSWFGADIPVGAFNLDHPKECVSGWHWKAYGEIPPSREARVGAEVLLEQCDEDTTLVTGAPLKNLREAMKLPGFHVGRWVAQGGFAGQGVVPVDKQLPKFRGLRTCPTFNLNGDPKAALRALVYPGIGERYFVSKNVCHGVVYDREMHDLIESCKHTAYSLQRIWEGMEFFLQQRYARPKSQAPDVEEPVEEPVTDDPSMRVGKKLHDPLAACCAIDLSIGTWAEVELFREQGKWGSRLCSGTNTWIIVDYDHARFLEVFTAHAMPV